VRQNLVCGSCEKDQLLNPRKRSLLGEIAKKQGKGTSKWNLRNSLQLDCPRSPSRGITVSLSLCSINPFGSKKGRGWNMVKGEETRRGGAGERKTRGESRNTIPDMVNVLARARKLRRGRGRRPETIVGGAKNKRPRWRHVSKKVTQTPKRADQFCMATRPGSGRSAPEDSKKPEGRKLGRAIWEKFHAVPDVNEDRPKEITT